MAIAPSWSLKSPELMSSCVQLLLILLFSEQEFHFQSIPLLKWWPGINWWSSSLVGKCELSMSHKTSGTYTFTCDTSHSLLWDSSPAPGRFFLHWFIAYGCPMAMVHRVHFLLVPCSYCWQYNTFHLGWACNQPLTRLLWLLISYGLSWGLRIQLLGLYGFCNSLLVGS